MRKLQKNYDVVIAGCGISGLYTALKLNSSLKVLLLSKGDNGLSNSALAQGGIAAVVDNPNDSTQLHFEDTLIAGGGVNDKRSVDVLVNEGPEDVKELVKLGVDFDRGDDGELMRTLEGGHSRNRIFHHRDNTGYEMTKTLLERVDELSNVEFSEYTAVYAAERLPNGGFRVNLIKNDEHIDVYCRFLVLATGGLGRIYKYSTSSSVCTGDGIRLASEMGAKIKDLHLIQFHPTAFAGEDISERFLISEAVRGEGAKLLNCNGERFMHRYDDRGELAPRDVVSRAIILEARRTGSDKFYLDITERGEEFLRKRFPMISGKCLENGIDIAKDWIPVFPCQHYLMGGIAVDLCSRTRVYGLYAVGECSNTGVHGKNRLASNSLLEALVFSRRAAQDINEKSALPFELCYDENDYVQDYSGAPVPSELRNEICDIMQRSYFVFPDTGLARQGLKSINAIIDRLRTGKFKKDCTYEEILSMATIASMVLKEIL